MTDIRSQKDRATVLLSKGKLPAALVEFRRIVEGAPGDVSARQKIAEILARQGHIDEAVTEYAEAVRRYAEDGLFFKAVALSRVILTLEPEHQLAQQQIAELYAQRHSVRPTAPPPPRKVRAQETTRLDSHAIALAYVKLVSTPQPAPAPAPEVAARPISVAPLPQATRDALPRIPLFSSLTRVEFLAVLNGAMQARAYPAGTCIVTEGDPAGFMYAVAQGQLSVWRKSRQVGVLEEGAFFGEMALLSGTWRMATVTAETDVVVLEFPSESMDRIIGHHPGVRAGLEQFCRERLLANLMRANSLLQCLTRPERAALSAAFQPCGFAADQVVVEEGTRGAAVFVLVRGHCAVLNPHPDRGSFPDLEEGDAFGDLSVLTERPVAATVRTRGPVTALRVAAEDFRAIVMGNPEVSRRVRLANQRDVVVSA